MIDLSILKNIDFSDKDNLLFLSIFLVIAVVVFFIFIVIAVEIVKAIKKVTIRIFNIDVKKPKFNQKGNTDWLRQSQNAAEVKEQPNEPLNASKSKVVGGDFTRNIDSEEKKSGEEKKDAVKSYKEKEEKGVAEGLSKLKSGGSAGGDTLESKMPSRTGGQEEGDKFKEIKIPTPKRFTPNNVTPGAAGGTPAGEIKIPTSSGVHSQPLTYEKEKQEAAKITLQGQGRELVESMLGGKESVINSATGSLKIPVADKGASSQRTKQDTSIFGGAPEVSRTKLETKMKTDTNVWQAARQTGLNLSPVERAKLVKEVFSSALGRNISKTDLKSGITKLNRKMLNSKDSTEHAKIRKEIKFFKKIGGIK